MRDEDELVPTERDEAIYAVWEGGKTLRVLARQFSTSVTEIERAIDRCLPVFDTQNQMRAYKREIQRLEDLGAKYHALAMGDDASPEMAHVYARINERRCAMSGWSSVNIRLDPFAAQVKEQPTQHEKIRDAIFRLKYGPQWQPSDSFGADGALLAPPTADQNGDQNRSNSEELSTRDGPARDKGATLAACDINHLQSVSVIRWSAPRCLDLPRRVPFNITTS
jgi:hypothetical protein